MSGLATKKRRALALVLAGLGFGAGLVAYDLAASSRMLVHSDCEAMGELVGAYFDEIDSFRGKEPANWYDVKNLYSKLAEDLDRVMPRTDELMAARHELQADLLALADAIYQFNPSAGNRERLAKQTADLRLRFASLSERCHGQ